MVDVLSGYSVCLYFDSLVGQTTVGRRQSEHCSDHDIQLNGVLVAENHWYCRQNMSTKIQSNTVGDFFIFSHKELLILSV